MTGMTARGATITVDLPNLVGTLTYNDPPLTASFDAGVQFSSIELIVVRVMAEGEAGELRLITYPGGIMFDPDSPPPTIIDKPFTPPLLISFANEEGNTVGNYAHPLAGAETTWQAEFNVAFYESLQLKFYGHLLDGMGELRLTSANHFITVPGTQLEILEPSVLHVAGAQIVITGTLAAVPTPGSGAMLLAGSGLIGAVRHWRRKQN